MSKLPAELKGLKPFLVRSLEMERADPTISYYTHKYATQMALEYYKQDQSKQDIRQYVMYLMDEMEKKKALLPPDVDAASHFETFVTQLFVKADSEDRKQGSTKQTAQTFLVCSYFIEAMSIFGELPPDWEEKRKYAKWKANDIVKALKEGRQPEPGGPNERGEQGPTGYIPSPIDFPPEEPKPAPREDPVRPPESPKPPQRDPPSNQPPPPQRDPPSNQPPPSRNPPTSKTIREAVESAKKLAKTALQELEFKNIDQAKQALANALLALNSI